jgi:type I restriction enzyme M protein
MSVNHSEISSFIWNVCDDVLRGLFKPHEYGDYTKSLEVR